MTISIVILAAGQGTRMRSTKPKVLHPLAGRPLLSHVCATASELQADPIVVVYGHGGEVVRDQLCDLEVRWVEQAQQLGTGHAVSQALPHISSAQHVLILYGDVPLISHSTLEGLIAIGRDSGFGLLTVELDDPTGYGRIVRDGTGAVVSIVEEKDATVDQRAIQEVNTGLMVVSVVRLRDWLAKLDNQNSQGEYYLTDIVAMAVKDGLQIDTTMPKSRYEVMGVNDRVQLAQLERHYQMIQAERLMREGVTIIDPSRFDLRGEVTVGTDVVIDVNVVLEGRVTLGNNVVLGANTFIRNTEIGDHVTVLPNCVIEESRIGSRSHVGPFSRLRPDSDLKEEVKVGNFVEIKKSTIQKGSKVNHLSYVGDTEMGESVNVGAGTITCNYDGANKHKTIIGNDVFIGSDTQLIAPVAVGDGATIGAGTTVTKDVRPEVLALSRAPQKSLQGWQRPQKNKPKE